MNSTKIISHIILLFILFGNTIDISSVIENSYGARKEKFLYSLNSSEEFNNQVNLAIENAQEDKFFIHAVDSLGRINAPVAIGITVEPTLGLVTTEGGGTANFTVVLDSQPTADVTIGLSSSDDTEGTVNLSSLTFTTGDWDQAQPVMVSGIDDDVDDGDVAYLVVTAPASSDDPDYNGIDAVDVSVTNQDDDTAGITVAPTLGLVTTEGGGTANFTVVLDSQPTANVMIGLSSSDTTEGTVNLSSLTFTTGDWDQAQQVTVSGIDDDVDDGNVAYQVVTAQASSGDPLYNVINPADVSVNNQDNDTAGITVAPTFGVTTEGGGTANFTVVLDSQPTANVTIGLSSSDSTEGTVDLSQLIFTTVNWDQAQQVTVSGVDDDVDDGNVAYQVVTAQASSGDPLYNVINPIDVSVINVDNDTAGITVDPTSGLLTTEKGGTANFTVVLDSQPTANVTIGLNSSDTTEGTVSPDSLTFTPSNWDVVQTVTVTGVDDPLDDGNVSYQIVTLPASSSDSLYNGMNPPNVSVTNRDDEGAGITILPTSGLLTTEKGGTANFTVVLDSQPTANVTIGLGSTDTTEGTVSTGLLTFTPGNWDLEQTVTVTGVDDGELDGDVSYTISTSDAASSDPLYNGLVVDDVEVTNRDDDGAMIIVTPKMGLITTEDIDQDSFNVVLNSQPTEDVTIGLSSSDITEGTVNLSSLTFTPGNWNLQQSVTVSGVDDDDNDGDVAYQVITAPALSDDPLYSGINPDNVSVTNLENDAPVANDDEYALDEDDVLVVSVPGVLHNDSDNNDENDALSTTLVSGVENGLVVLSIDGSFIYTPTLHYNGSDQFVYAVTDGVFTDTAMVNIMIRSTNSAPLAEDDTFISNTSLSIAAPGVLSNDSDLDVDDVLQSLLKNAVSDGELVFNLDGSFTYTPTIDYNGIVNFTYSAFDGSAESDPAAVSIVIDTIRPTVTWESPITNEGIIFVREESILLRVMAEDDNLDPVVPIEKVRFYRWDSDNAEYLDIEYVDTLPYQVDFDTSVLNSGWNQIFAKAIDIAGNKSERQFIWLFREFPFQLFLPMIY